MTAKKLVPQQHAKEKRASAGLMFRRGMDVPAIAKELKISPRTVYHWKTRDSWDLETPAGGVEDLVSRRIAELLANTRKTDSELSELGILIDKAGDFAVKLANARAIKAKTKPAGEAPRREKRGPYQKKQKNDVSEITAEQLCEIRERVFFKFKYQETWWNAKQDSKAGKYRFILKSRQIGATYYFAWEALEDAILAGDNQIFLSASLSQAEVFKAYILYFARDFLGVELKGQKSITLSNGAELRFLSTNAATAASYHGHLYVDEVFWIPNFQKVWDQASGMASHKKWRMTVFSVPSAKSHPAYRMWSGADWCDGRNEKLHFTFDLPPAEVHGLLKDGHLAPDKWWRQIVTVEDAEAAGCDLFDIDDLRARNRRDAFENKYLCRFIDDARSAFPLALLLDCGVDVSTWKDYRKDAPRPFGNKPVAIGYDPSRTGDTASIVVLAVPTTPKDKWRVLERADLHRVSHQYQASRIREMMERYKVVHIGVDVSGEGRGVWPYLEDISCAYPISYTLGVKADLVVKALDVIQPPARLEFDATDTGIVQAFLQIRKTITDSTSQVTYTAARSNATGHADVAWAIMHALIYEPIAGESRKATVVFSD
jgi:uncharacterized protein YjcR